MGAADHQEEADNRVTIIMMITIMVTERRYEDKSEYPWEDWILDCAAPPVWSLEVENQDWTKLEQIMTEDEFILMCPEN